MQRIFALFRLYEDAQQCLHELVTSEVIEEREVNIIANAEESNSFVAAQLPATMEGKTNVDHLRSSEVLDDLLAGHPMVIVPDGGKLTAAGAEAIPMVEHSSGLSTGDGSLEKRFTEMGISTRDRRLFLDRLKDRAVLIWIAGENPPIQQFEAACMRNNAAFVVRYETDGKQQGQA